MAEARGFEPPRHCCPHDFESCAFNHSATLPFLILSQNPPTNKKPPPRAALNLRCFLFFAVRLGFIILFRITWLVKVPAIVPAITACIYERIIVPIRQLTTPFWISARNISFFTISHERILIFSHYTKLRLQHPSTATRIVQLS